MLKKILNAARNPDSLGERALNASLWQFGAMGVQYPLRLASNLILTRLLMPEAFGMMAIIMMLHVGLYLFTDVGIIQSVMRDPRGAEERFLRVAWVVQVIRGLFVVMVLCLIGALVMVLGPVLAAPDTVYADPILPWLIWFSGIGLMAKALESANVLLAQRQMRQKLVIVTEIAGQILAIIVMGVLAWATGSVWALAIGPVSASILRSVLSHIVFPGPRMAFAWDRQQMHEMWSYGKWLIGAAMGGFMLHFGDRLILSALIDKHTFGIYSIAVVWIEMGTTLLQKIAGSTLIPSLSSTIREAPEKLRSVLGKFIRAFDALGIAIFAGVILLADVIFDYLYTDTYADAAFYARLLAFKLLLEISLPPRHFVMASGNSRLYAQAHLVGAGLFLVGCYCGFQIASMPGAILFSVIGGLITPALILFDRDLRRLVSVPLELVKLAIIATAAAMVAVTIG